MCNYSDTDVIHGEKLNFKGHICVLFYLGVSPSFMITMGNMHKCKIICNFSESDIIIIN